MSAERHENLGLCAMCGEIVEREPHGGHTQSEHAGDISCKLDQHVNCPVPVACGPVWTLRAFSAEVERLMAENERLRKERTRDAIDGQAALDEANNEIVRLRWIEQAARWTHPCDAVLNVIALWVKRCPHCGRPADYDDAALGEGK